MPADHILSRQILQAIKDTVNTYLPAKVPGYTSAKATWKFGDTYVDNNDAPAITLVDRGWAKTFECTRGAAADGSVVAGLLGRRYSIEGRVWLKAKDEETLRDALRQWCGGIAAVLDAAHRLGEDKIVGSAKAGENFHTMDESSAWFGVGQLSIQVDAYIRQGDVAL